MSNRTPDPKWLVDAVTDAMRDCSQLPERRAAREAAERAESPRVLIDPSQLAALEKQRQDEWRERLRKSAPIAKWEKAWDADLSYPATKAVDDWLRMKSGRHLCLFGAVGCGKSIAAAHAVKHWVKSSAGCVSWMRPNDVVSAVMHSYDQLSPKLLERIVIDDVGFNEKAEFSDALCELLDRPGHTLLMTSNLTTPQFRERYTDKRLIDRLNDTAIAIRVKGGSRRSQDGGF
jgi:DNA replication protein DnaC